jgi:two-component system, NarL family, nitrate/nitrite response regulator NarL
MSSAAGPPRVSRFGWSLAESKGGVARSDHPDSPSVLIATADPDLRGRWRGVLHDGYPVRDVSARDCLERTISTLSPDVLLLDLDLLGVGGIGDGPIIRALARETKVVLLSGCPNEREGIRILKAGARGYCNRNVEPQLLRKIVDRIHDGEIWAERKLIPRLLEEYASHPEDRPEGFSKPDGRLSLLTPREREIAFLIGAGASNKEIASRLRVGEGTVKAHLTAIFRKLGFSDRLHLGLFLVSPSVAAAHTAGSAEGPIGPPLDRFSS